MNGKIVTRARFSNGTNRFLVADEPRPEVELEDDDEKAFDEAMASVRRGEAIPLETFRAILQCFLGASIDDILAGRFTLPSTCPSCKQPVPD